MKGLGFITGRLSNAGGIEELDTRIVPRAQAKAVREYLEAHALLPEGSTLPRGEVSRLCRLLDGGGGTRDELVRALLILAHVGRDPALSALRRYARRTPRGLEGLAALALDECEVWAKEPVPPFAPPAVDLA